MKLYLVAKSADFMEDIRATVIGICTSEEEALKLVAKHNLNYIEDVYEVCSDTEMEIAL